MLIIIHVSIGKSKYLPPPHPPTPHYSLHAHAGKKYHFGCTLFTLFHFEPGSLLCLLRFHSKSLFSSDSIFVFSSPFPSFSLLYSVHTPI